MLFWQFLLLQTSIWRTPEQICGKRLCYGKRVGSKWLGVLNKLFNTDFLALDKKIPAFLKGLKLVVLNASVHDGTY